MAVERDTAGEAGLVRRSAAVVRTAFDAEAPAGQRRTALLKTVAVGSVAVLAPLAGADVLATNPGILNTLTLPLSNPDVLTGVIAFGGTAVLGGGVTAIGHGLERYSDTELKNITRVFSHLRSAGLVAGGVLGISALAMAGAGAEHVLGDGAAIGSVLGFGAAGAGAAGAGAHLIERFWARRLPQPERALGE